MFYNKRRWLILICFAFILPLSVANGEMTPEEIRRFQYDFGARLYDQYARAVVYVTGDYIDPQQKDLEEFFNISNERLPNAIGTGFFILPSGYILTNAHGVYKSVDQIVETFDGKRYPAQIIGFIMSQDLALLKIDVPEPVPCIQFKWDGKILTGEPILTIGHPHGLKYTCTQGIVSAVGRRSTLTDIKVTLDNLLQSDAGINPGSSGGPWFNASGEVVGMTASRRSGSDNIAFGVATSTFFREFPRLFDIERRRGFQIGASVEGLNELRITKIVPDSAAQKAGLMENDRLLAINDKPIECMIGYIACADAFEPDKPTQWKIARTTDGKTEEKTLEVTPAATPALDANALLWSKAGIKVRPISGKECALCGLRVPKGFIIQQINAEFFKNLTHKPQVGDILARFDNVRPDSMAHLARLADGLQKGDRTNLVILRVTDKNTQASLLPAEIAESDAPQKSETPTDNAVNGKTDDGPASESAPSDNAQNESQDNAANQAPNQNAPSQNALDQESAQTANVHKPGTGEQVKTRIDIMDFPIK